VPSPYNIKLMYRLACALAFFVVCHVASLPALVWTLGRYLVLLHQSPAGAGAGAVGPRGVGSVHITADGWFVSQASTPSSTPVRPRSGPTPGGCMRYCTRCALTWQNGAMISG